MRKLLLAMMATIALICSMIPGAASAIESNYGAIPVVIEIGSNGTPIESSGEGWTYAPNEDGRLILTLNEGRAFTLTGNPLDIPHERALVVNHGTIVDGEFNTGVNNFGNIEGGTFRYFVGNWQMISGGTFNRYVTNDTNAVIAGGVFNVGTHNNRVDNYGIIRSGTFNCPINNSGTIEGNGIFNSYIQNGYYRFDADRNKACSILGGTFNSETIENFGTIAGGTFDGEVLSGGIIAGGTFSSASSVSNNDEGITTDGGTISGGTFAGSVVNGSPDPNENAAIVTGGTFENVVENHDAISGGSFIRSSIVQNYGTIAAGTFDGTVCNKQTGTVKDGQASSPTFNNKVENDGIIEGGFFAHSIITGGKGTLNSCTFPANMNLARLSLAGTGTEQPVAMYEKNSSENNRYTLAADAGYMLPASVSVRLGSENGQELAAGADYAYDAATGIVTVKKSAVVGPLYLAASGVPAPTPPTPAPAPTTPETPTTPTPLPEPPEPPSSAKALASTGDSPLPIIALSVALVAGATAAACAAARRRKRLDQR